MVSRFRFLAIAMVILVQYSPVFAAQIQYPIVRSRIENDFARVTFEWKKENDFIASANSKQVTIKFNSAGKPNLGAIVANLAPYITSAKANASGDTVILTTNQPYKIRTFVKDNISGIDLLGIDPKIQEKLKQKQKKEQEKLAKAEAPRKVKKTELARLEAERLQAEKLTKLEPAAGKTTQKTSPEKPEKKTEKPEPTTQNNKPAQPQEKTQEKTPEKKADPEQKKPAIDDSAAAPSEQTALAETINKVGISAADDSATLRFPLEARTAFAVFIRNHYLWIVLGKNLKLDLSEFSTMEKTVIGKPEIIENPKATILYMPIDDNIHPSISQEDNSNNLAILLTQKKKTAGAAIAIEVSTAPPAPPHVLVPALEMTEPIIARDPLIGDSLIITPLFKVGEGIAPHREFVEFSMLETAQGIAVAKKTDDVVAMQLRNGLRITTQKGASISAGLPKVDEKAGAGGTQASPTLYPYNLWKIDGAKLYDKHTQKLFHQIVESENVQDANNARLRMAQFYLSEGLAPEAIALLDSINRTNPSFYRTAKLAALRGAANFLMSRFVEAGRDFAASELNNNKEMDYWRAVLSDLLGNSSQTYDYLLMNEDYISKYPPIFRQRLAIIAADRAIAAKEYNVALKIFDSLHQDHLLDSINVYINFLMAKISLSTGQIKEATETLDKLADDEKHPFVRARAEFTRIARDLETGQDKDSIIDRLERLRINWHGDSLELQILTILGDLYYEKKDYVNSMRVWNNGVQAFKNTAAAIDMTRKMEETFIVMFNEGIADKLPPLEALALYYEYRTYMPTGSSGNEMMVRLADRLVGVDLLEQAAELLDHQMHNQLEKEQRSAIGAKLASIYLLNNQPQKALNALQDSVYGENAALLRLERNRLTAEAMVELGKTDLAMQTLGLDDSADAEQIRINVYWKAKDWGKLTASIENLLKLRPNITAPITISESENLIKLALAYVFQDNREQLQYLRDYFTPLMTDNPNLKVFEFITAQDVNMNSRNFDEVLKSVENTRSFITNYKTKILLGNQAKNNEEKSN